MAIDRHTHISQCINSHVIKLKRKLNKLPKEISSTFAYSITHIYIITPNVTQSVSLIIPP